MRISYSHHFIFIHVPKTAGLSLVTALAPYTHDSSGYWMNSLLDKIGIHVNHWTHYRNKRFRPHTSARQVQRQLPRDVFDNMFKFGFVRNPWERVISYYHYVLRHPNHKRHKRARSLGGVDSFVQWACAAGKMYSQADMLVDDQDNLLVDYVGRFESLSDDFQRVCDRLQISVTLPHVNKSNYGDYRSYYNPRTRQVVAETCRKDIEFFGYSFD
jgi:hypothetical protein